MHQLDYVELLSLKGVKMAQNAQDMAALAIMVDHLPHGLHVQSLCSVKQGFT